MAKILGVHMKAPIISGTSFIPVITSSTGTPTNYTATGDQFKIGDRAFLKVQILFTGSPGTFSKIGFNLPSGLIMDISKMPGAVVDETFLGDGTTINTGAPPALKVCYASTSSVFVKRIITTSGSNPVNTDNTANMGSGDVASGTRLTLWFDVPIVGWSADDILRLDGTKI